jgi:hypothetical protein
VSKEWIDRYRGRFDCGYEVLRVQHRSSKRRRLSVDETDGPWSGVTRGSLNRESAPPPERSALPTFDVAIHVGLSQVAVAAVAWLASGRVGPNRCSSASVAR